MPVGGLSLESMLALVQSQAGERRRQQAAQETRQTQQTAPTGQQPCGPSTPAAEVGDAGEAGARWNGFNPGPDRNTPPVDPATAGQEPGANLYQPQAAATAEATSAASTATPAAAPTAMEQFRQANPGLKTNQDAINHFYKAGGGTWEGASRAARDAGLNLSTFVRDRRGSLPGGGASTTPTAPTQPGGPTAPTEPTAPTTPTTPTDPGAPSASGTARSIKGFREVDVEKLRARLPAQAKHLAESFVESGRKHNVDPLALAAIAKHETGNFTSSAFRNKNNAMGISNARGPTQQPSHEASIDKMAKLLGSTTGGPYKNASTIGEIANIYAPIGAGNDPTGLNNHWARGVARFADDFERSVRGGDAVS